MNRPKVQVNPGAGSIYVPGKGNLPLVGVDEKQLAEKQKVASRQELMMRRQILSTFKCLECKREWQGKLVRVKPHMQDGHATVRFYCPDDRCGGPVVLHKDALDMRSVGPEPRHKLRETRHDKAGMGKCTLKVFEHWINDQFTAGGNETEIRVGEQVPCTECTEALILCEDGRWRVIR